MTQLYVPRQDSAEPEDDAIVLEPDQALQVNRFREELTCETDAPRRYKLCVQKRDELLDQHAEVQILIAIYGHVMSGECPEYRERQQKQTKNRKSGGRRSAVGSFFF